MRIAMVSPFPQQRNVFTGGVEAAASVLAYGLIAVARVEIHVIAPSSGSSTVIEERDGMMLHWLPTGRLPGFIGYWTSYRRSLHSLLGKIRPDITHFQGMAGWTLGYELPYVFTVHGIAERDMSYQAGHLLALRKTIIALVEEAGRRRSKHTIVISPYVLDQISSQICGEHHFIENPVDGDVFQLKRSSHSQQVLYVGRINKRKNIEGLIEAFALVRSLSPKAELRIVGEADDDDSYLDKCRRLVNFHGLQDVVHFLGKADRRMVLNELSQACCLVLVSRQETAPIIVEEAMAAEVPIVASNLCGLPYLIQDGVTGFLVDPNNAQQIAEKIHMLMTNSKIALAMGEKAREVAVSRFHAHVIAERTIALYHEVLKECTYDRIAPVKA
jgi:glycosyltransferase involved in cell wall biosynthesis